MMAIIEIDGYGIGKNGNGQRFYGPGLKYQIREEWLASRRATSQKYRHSKRGKQISERWRALNKDRLYQAHKIWRDKNRGYWRRYRAKKSMTRDSSKKLTTPI